MRDKNKKKPKRYKQYRLRMSDAEDARLKRLSEETGMSCADVMRDALERYNAIGCPNVVTRDELMDMQRRGYFEDDLK